MNAPTLIVGLGGTGSKIVLRVSKLASEEQKKRIGFAVFDTDVNELRQITEGNPFVHAIQTSTKLSVGEYLDIDHHTRDTWFPVNTILNSKTLTEGAGQVRAISRMAFETAVKAGKMENLHKAIEDLYRLEGDEYEQALRVIIVGSLAGGTGSGLILPVGLYIKNYLATHFRQSANITRGFFILPEVFFEVIKGQSERNNLKSNAYAALRELDAFLMKGDNSLPERYCDSVKMEFPCAGANEYEEYHVRPYDFCFLFDAQNADGKKLNSFNEYLDHAASCIYAQSIGPMNKRSNSSEDNTIRKLCEERGRNRYAGAGTSMVIYPMEDVKEYLALNWAKENVSKQWLLFDDMFKQRQKENAEKRAVGIPVKDIDPVECYITSVEQMDKNGHVFAKGIVESCMHFDETGFERKGNKWSTFVGALMEKIASECEEGDDTELGSKKRSINSSIVSLTSGDDKKTWNRYAEVYRQLTLYRAMVIKKCEDSASTIAYAIFRGSVGNGEKLPHEIESYMVDSNGDFIHPNAVRYFLYNSLKLMKTVKLGVDAELKDLDEFFATFEKNTFDDKTTTDTVETVSELAQTKKGNKNPFSQRLSADQEQLQKRYQKYLGSVDAFKEAQIKAVVLEEGIRYVKELCQSFEDFYRSFEDKVLVVNKKIAELSSKYTYIKGKATRYVCASDKCLKAMLEDMPYTGSHTTIDGKLAKDIFARIKSYTLETNKSVEEDYFGDIFQKGILGYFRESVLRIYREAVDMDIIEAIEKEARYVKGITKDAEVRQYVKHVLDETKILASPFIEKPLGEEKDPINSCAYNNKLNPKDDSPRSAFIDAELKNFGGEEDADIPKNTILFYKSFYGLRATDLSKFAPPQKTDTYSRTAGEYYKAYFELIRNIHPETHKSRVITPHIDRWWHTVSKMPDLDDGNQLRQEDEVHAAFFWGLLLGYFDMYENGYDEKVYRLSVDELDMDEESKVLIVSNGTPCDTLYEVVDALSIYPDLVYRINNKVKGLILDEQNKNQSVETGMLYERLRKFRLAEYPLEDTSENRKGVRSIFELPILFKKSVTQELYYEEKVIRILKAELNEIRNYLMKFCSKKELPEYMGKLLMEQFELYMDSMEIESRTWRDIYKDSLFSRICKIVAHELEELGLKDNAKSVKEQDEKLRKQ